MAGLERKLEAPSVLNSQKNQATTGFRFSKIALERPPIGLEIPGIAKAGIPIGDFRWNRPEGRRVAACGAVVIVSWRAASYLGPQS